MTIDFALYGHAVLEEDSLLEMSRQLEECGRAVFRLFPSLERYPQPFPSGSCFVLHQHLRAITAAHVIEGHDDAQEWFVCAHSWHASAHLLALDRDNDLAVLQLANPAPSVLQADVLHSGVDSLAAWDWPDDANPTAHEFRPALHSQLRLPALWGDSGGRIPFVGHVRHGMSGGPLVAAIDGRVIGVIVKARPPADEHEIIETWWSSVHADWHGTPEEMNLLHAGLRAQLALGLGLAVPVEEALKLLSGAV